MIYPYFILIFMVFTSPVTAAKKCKIKSRHQFSHSKILFKEKYLEGLVQKKNFPRGKTRNFSVLRKIFWICGVRQFNLYQVKKKFRGENCGNGQWGPFDWLQHFGAGSRKPLILLQLTHCLFAAAVKLGAPLSIHDNSNSLQKLHRALNLNLMLPKAKFLKNLDLPLGVIL